MPLTFQGGQAIPAQGTAAFNAAVAAPSGNGSYNPSTGVVSSGNSTIYSPNSAIATPAIPSSITGANTAPNSPIPIPQTPQVPNLLPTILGNNAGLSGNGVTPQANGLLSYQTPAEKVTAEGASSFDSFIKNLKAPVKTADIYNTEYANAGIADKQQQVQNFTNEINTITAKANADTLSLTGQGRGVPEVIIGGQQAQVAKEAAIKVLPIQAQLAAAQGNLKLAQEHLDTVFKLKIQDAQAENDFSNKQIELAYNFFDKTEQRKLDGLKSTSDQNFKLLTDSINFGQTLATKALDSGDAALAARITSATSSGLPSASSPTFAADLAAFNKNIGQYASSIKGKTDSQIVGSETGGYYNVIKDPQGNILKTVPVGVGGNKGTPQDVSQTLSSFASQYSETGKLPSPADLKPYGITIGQVTLAAKEAPKSPGVVVSRSTGVKPSSLSSTQADGISALYDLTKKLESAKTQFDSLNTGVVAGLAKTVFYTKAQQQYDDLKSEIVDLLARARSGAALTQDEVKNYESKLPGRFNNTLFLGGNGSTSIDDLKNSIEGKLNTNLDTTGTAIYGYSKVNVNGTPRTVGEVLNIGDVHYRVLPDGTLTDKI